MSPLSSARRARLPQTMSPFTPDTGQLLPWFSGPSARPRRLDLARCRVARWVAVGRGSGWRTGRSPGWAPPDRRPRRTSTSPSSQPAPPWAPHPTSRNTRRVARTSWRRARRRRSARTAPATSQHRAEHVQLTHAILADGASPAVWSPGEHLVIAIRACGRAADRGGVAGVRVDHHNLNCIAESLTTLQQSGAHRGADAAVDLAEQTLTVAPGLGRPPCAGTCAPNLHTRQCTPRAATAWPRSAPRRDLLSDQLGHRRVGCWGWTRPALVGRAGWPTVPMTTGGLSGCASIPGTNFGRFSMNLRQVAKLLKPWFL
jgi:hypothetical protein